MKKATRHKTNGSEMRAHYDIPWDKAVRGKYARRFRGDWFYVAIDRELMSAFPDADAVNAALHELAAMKPHDASGFLHRKSA